MTGSQPRLCLGTVQFGVAYGIAGRSEAVGDAEARAILEVAHAGGIRRLDTAPAYGDIEARLGRLCTGLDFTIMSKIPALPADCTDDQAAAFVTRSLELSRERLGDKLRRILFHESRDLAGPAGSRLWEAAAQWCAREEVALGVSTYGPEQLDALGQIFPVQICQMPGNAFDQRLTGYGGHFEAVEIALRSVFLQGLLLMTQNAGSKRLPAAAAALDRWHRRCSDFGLTPLECALAIAKTLPGADFCAVGVDGTAHLEQIIAAWNGSTPREAPELAITDTAIIDPRQWSIAN